ncbi:hypothetical protein B0H10DRAFT_1953105 [Mycena sp. CBHHK59/15]|nr:hypothetical protein B0H10DRAFT_1953105 [Mycena sp. CBHHK59/15]
MPWPAPLPFLPYDPLLFQGPILARSLLAETAYGLVQSGLALVCAREHPWVQLAWDRGPRTGLRAIFVPSDRGFRQHLGRTLQWCFRVVLMARGRATYLALRLLGSDVLSLVIYWVFLCFSHPRCEPRWLISGPETPRGLQRDRKYMHQGGRTKDRAEVVAEDVAKDDSEEQWRAAELEHIRHQREKEKIRKSAQLEGRAEQPLSFPGLRYSPPTRTEPKAQTPHPFPSGKKISEPGTPAPTDGAVQHETRWKHQDKRRTWTNNLRRRRSGYTCSEH